MKVPKSTIRLVQIAAWGGVVLASTGFYLRQKLIDKIRDQDYYKSAMKKLRSHAGAVHYLGEPIKDRRFNLTDTENNNSDGSTAKFCIPVSGPNDRGHYYIFAERIDKEWKLINAELELKSKQDSRLVITK